MARIYLDARCITDKPCGVGRSAGELIRALARLAPHHDFVVLRHVSNREPATTAPNVREEFLARTDDNFVHVAFGARMIRRAFERCGPPDLYHALFHLLPVGFPGSLKPRPRIVVTGHDLIWLDHPMRLANKIQGAAIWSYARVAIPRSIRLADRVICGTDAMARRFAAFTTPDAVVTIPFGIAAEFFGDVPPLPDPFGSLGDPGHEFVIAVANSKGYKNLPLLIRAFGLAVRKGLRARLVLVGDCRRLARNIDAAGIRDRVVVTGFIPNLDLRALVGRAMLLVHPSLAEGFGLPTLEAMALGTPTAISDIALHREVAADAAMRFDPHDADALAAVLLRVEADAGLRRDLSQRGRQRAAIYDWTSAALKTLEVYESVLNADTPS